MPRRRVTEPDTGAGSVLVLGIAGVVVVLGAGLGLLGQAAVARHRAEAAADLAALAAADVLLGRRDGDPCGEAARTAELNRARLTACVPAPDGSVTVSVDIRPGERSTVLGAALGPARASARAGPAP